MGIIQRITAKLGRLVGKAKRALSKRSVQVGVGGLALFLLYRRTRGPRLDPSRTVDVPVSGSGYTY